MVKNIINEFLYTGAGPGEKLATQQAVKNMSYGQIGKNIVDEGGFGYGKNLRGYDPNYTGKGAIPRNTAFQKMMAFPKYAAGAFNLGDKASNLAGGTPGQRQLYEKVLQSPVSKAGAGILRTAASLPMQAVMAGPYAISQAMGPSVAAGDFINDEQFQLGQSEVGVGDFYSGNTNLLSDAEKAMMADQYDVGYSFADNERITPNIPSNVPSNFVDTGRDFSMFDQARMGDAVSGTNVQGMDLEMDPGAFMNPNIQPSQNMFQRAGNAIQGGLGSIRDFAVDRGMSAKNLLGSGAAMAMGLPGIVGSGAMSLLGGLGNMFERRDGMATVDEFGNLISGADLDRQNALGGYYTDAARDSRNRARSIAFMQQRKADGKKYGERRLEQLLAQQAKEDAARQAAFDSIMSQGNNQQSFYDSLNQGSGSTAVSGNPNTSGAGDAPGYSGPSTFADGGLASMFVRRK